MNTENFEKFRDFLNSQSTEFILETLAGKQALEALKIIRERFDVLGLNEDLK